MRARLSSVVLALLASCSATAPALRSSGTRQAQAGTQAQTQAPVPALGDVTVYGKQLNVGVGVRAFEDEALGTLDDQVAWMLDYCEPIDLGPVRLEGGLHYSYDEADDTSGGQDVRLKGQTFEGSVGLNVSQRFGRLRPYVGFGAALLFVDLRGIDEDVDLVFDDDDVTFGGYVKGGLFLQITPTSHVGVEFRHFEGGDVSLDGTEIGTAYDQVVFVFGTSFR